MEKVAQNPDGSRLIHRYEPMAPADRPQDPQHDGAALAFEALEHGGEYPDDMPQAIRVTDAKGRNCVYVPTREEGRVVKSQGFELIKPE